MASILSNPMIVGTAAGIFTACSLLPQLYKIIQKKKATDISILMLIVLFCGVGLWIYYGILKKDLPIIITNSFSLLVNIGIIFFSVKYRKHR
jgi:MtN3 and saliva related transmembrane protein